MRVCVLVLFACVRVIYRQMGVKCADNGSSCGSLANLNRLEFANLKGIKPILVCTASNFPQASARSNKIKIVVVNENVEFIDVIFMLV